MYSSMLYVPPYYFTPSHNDLPRFIEKFEISVIAYILRVLPSSNFIFLVKK